MMQFCFAKVLLAGAHGQLASAISRSIPENCQIIALGRQDLDICDAQNVQKVLLSHRPDLVINGAAYNLVDQAETDQDSAFRINRNGPATLAQYCGEMAIPLLHFSTDFVFDGTQKTPYTEEDAPNPLSVYAASKLAGERAVLEKSPQNWVVRVSRVFGPITLQRHSAGKKPTGNFPLTMLRLAKTHKTLRVVNDEIGSPSYTHDLAAGIWELLEKSDGGLFHMTNAGEVSFADFARAIFEIAGTDCDVQNISAQEYGLPAKRPAYSTLDNSKIQKIGVKPLRYWREALEDYLLKL